MNHRKFMLNSAIWSGCPQDALRGGFPGRPLMTVVWKLTNEGPTRASCSAPWQRTQPTHAIFQPSRAFESTCCHPGTVYGVAELRIWPCAVTDKALRRHRRATDVAPQPLELAALAGLGRRAGVQWRSALPLHMKPPQRERSHERVHSRERVRMHV
jgi:hypothetical protein